MGKGGGSGEGSGHGAGLGSGAYRGKSERIAVPAMPMPMAVVCCILNFLLPGFGTILAGFTNFCCSRNEDISQQDRFVSCLTNLGIGCAQLLAVGFFLLGWIWSCAWGVFFIGMSAEYYHKNRAEDVDGNRGMVISTQPNIHVVAMNPGTYSTPIDRPGITTVIRQPVGTQFGPPVIGVGHATVTTSYPTSVSSNQVYPNDMAPPPYPGPPQLYDSSVYPEPLSVSNKDGSVNKSVI